MVFRGPEGHFSLCAVSVLFSPRSSVSDHAIPLKIQCFFMNLIFIHLAKVVLKKLF